MQKSVVLLKDFNIYNSSINHPLSEKYEQIESIEDEKAYIFRGKNEISVYRVYADHTIRINVPDASADTRKLKKRNTNARGEPILQSFTMDARVFMGA